MAMGDRPLFRQQALNNYMKSSSQIETLPHVSRRLLLLLWLLLLAICSLGVISMCWRIPTSLAGTAAVVPELPSAASSPITSTKQTPELILLLPATYAIHMRNGQTLTFQLDRAQTPLRSTIQYIESDNLTTIVQRYHVQLDKGSLPANTITVVTSAQTPLPASLSTHPLPIYIATGSWSIWDLLRQEGQQNMLTTHVNDTHQNNEKPVLQ
ncbi:MAG TPA: hypothetical protein VL461_02710 [Dictyobacter sp.]|jgi:hypothetical protein|nr:hypothetical protein [Dictyobacter sp.]